MLSRAAGAESTSSVSFLEDDMVTLEVCGQDAAGHIFSEGHGGDLILAPRKNGQAFGSSLWLAAATWQRAPAQPCWKNGWKGKQVQRFSLIFGCFQRLELSNPQGQKPWSEVWNINLCQMILGSAQV